MFQISFWRRLRYKLRGLLPTKPMSLDSPATDADLRTSQERIAELEAKLADVERNATRYIMGAKCGGFALWEWDLQSNHVWLSDEWEAMFGLPMPVINNAHEAMAQYVHPDDLGKMKEAFNTHIHGGEPFDMQYRIRFVDGTYRRVRGKAELIRDEEGNPLRLAGAVRDISEWYTSREELRRNQELIQQLVEASPVAMVVISGGGEEIQLRNRKFEELFGYTEEDIPRVTDWWPLAYPDPQYREEIFEAWSRRLAAAEFTDHRLVPIETIVTCKDGSKRNIQFEATSFGGDQLVVFFDVTELRQSEMQFRQVTEAIDEAFFLVSKDKRTGHFISPAFQTIFGVDPQQFEDDPAVIIELAHPADREALVTAFATDKTEPCEMEFRIIRPHDGALHTVQLSSFPVRDEKDEIVQYAGIFIDITNDKQMQQAMLDAGEAEKISLGSDIHDDVCNAISGLNIIYGVKARQLADSNPEAADLVTKLLGDLEEISEAARMLAHGRPSVYLRSANLLEALQKLIEKERDNFGNMEMVIETEETTEDLKKKTATQLYYIIREALRNALKYSEGTQVVIKLWKEDANFRVQIRDNGIGKAAEIEAKLEEQDNQEDEEEEGRLGFRAMRYRAHALSGSLEIADNAPGENGVQINCRVPL